MKTTAVTALLVALLLGGAMLVEAEWEAGVAAFKAGKPLKAAVARRCLEAGACVVNDVTALGGDPDMPAVVRDFGAGAILMHMQGTPATMQLAPRYDDVVGEVCGFLEERLHSLAREGITPERTAIDPGIGFGKTDAHNLRLSREIPAQTLSGYPMLVVLLLAIALGALGVWQLASDEQATGAVLLVVGVLVFVFVLAGFYLLQPNQAAAILLFGDYRGTDRRTGLRWVLPWLTRTRISTRIHNITSDTLKVNDQRGNPIEIAANVVWRVNDTAQAPRKITISNAVINCVALRASVGNGRISVRTDA